ncbi:hypothetical protein FACS1894110_18010 [Spirochaetia bacterium]|nr:hypothetical protein FACS1894110_18010 [Spirochaetia bacterium]
MTLVFNPAAFKHGITEQDVRWAMTTALFDEMMEGYDNKYLLIGFVMSGNLIEVMYNLVGEVPKSLWLLGLEFGYAKLQAIRQRRIAFHAMKCRNEVQRKLSKRG